MTFTSYKLFISTGLLLIATSALLRAQQVISLQQGNTNKAILVLPYYTYTFDSGLVEKDEVNTGKPHKGRSAFKDQLNKAASLTANSGGNVFMLKGMEDRGQKGNYKIWGTACKAGNYEQLRLRAIAQRDKQLEHGKYACLVIYRPAYSRGFNDEHAMELIINDTMHLDLKASTKYILKLAGAGNIKIANRNDIIVSRIDINPGSMYYVRAYKNIPGKRKLVKTGDSNIEMIGQAPYFEIMDPAQGELESSLVNEITITKKLGQ